MACPSVKAISGGQTSNPGTLTLRNACSREYIGTYLLLFVFLEAFLRKQKEAARKE